MRYLLLLLLLSVLFSASAQSFVKQEGGDFEWRITGRAMFDGGVFFSDKTSLGNGLVFTDGRIGITTRFLKNWEGKIEYGYSGGKMGIRDVYIAYNRGNSRLQAGHFFEPFGIEGRMGSADYRLMNAAPTASTFMERRKIGVAYSYDVKPFTLVAGFYSDADIDNIKDDNEGYSIAGKFSIRPVYEEDRLMHVAASFRFSEHDQTERGEYIYKGGVPTSVLSSSKNQFVKATITDMINQWKFGIDMIMIYKNTYLQAEYSAVNANRKASVENYFADGFYAQLGVLLLGNKKYNYNSRQAWVTNPAAKNLELLVRYNRTDLNDKDSEIMGGKLQDITFGVNYFINKYVAVRLNYVHAAIDKYSAKGDKEEFDYIQGRLQFNF
ncbi:hypothetical protein LJC12_02700 [Odoribacter sp. OttesenSCG-928-J03]|nr:hypothetical protein [Odoribacter sp. OttesenSCG-928-J03]MDL2283213.1 hypothetical protein [Odoribacter sp. OttesenSCG-928-G04]